MQIATDIAEKMIKTGVVIGEDGEFVFEGKLIPHLKEYPLKTDNNKEIVIEDIDCLFESFVEGYTKGLLAFEHKIKEHIGIFSSGDLDKIKAINLIEQEAKPAIEFKGEIYADRMLWYGYYQAQYYLCWLQRQKFPDKFNLIENVQKTDNNKTKSIVLTFKK